MKLVILFSVVILSIIQEGLSVKCWECRSDIDPKCADPFNNETFPITDCKYKTEYDPTVDPTRCRKASRKENGERITFRSCGHRTDPDIQDDEQFCTPEQDSSIEVLCMCNDKDGCNTSSSMTFLPLLLICPICFFLFQT